MEIKDSIRTALKELILPELGRIKQESSEIKAILSQTNKRLDDVNIHLADQSRRIDETNKRIDDLRADLTQRMDGVREELSGQNAGINRRLDRLYEIIVRRDEHSKLERRVIILERDINDLKQRLAA